MAKVKRFQSSAKQLKAGRERARRIALRRALEARLIRKANERAKKKAS